MILVLPRFALLQTIDFIKNNLSDHVDKYTAGSSEDLPSADEDDVNDNENKGRKRMSTKLADRHQSEDGEETATSISGISDDEEQQNAAGTSGLPKRSRPITPAPTVVDGVANDG